MLVVYSNVQFLFFSLYLINPYNDAIYRNVIFVTILSDSCDVFSLRLLPPLCIVLRHLLVRGLYTSGQWRSTSYSNQQQSRDSNSEKIDNTYYVQVENVNILYYVYLCNCPLEKIGQTCFVNKENCEIILKHSKEYFIYFKKCN